jgi:hypothetical protein
MDMRCNKIPTVNESDAEWMKGCERTILDEYSVISAKGNNGQLDPDQQVQIARKEGRNKRNTAKRDKQGK